MIIAEKAVNQGAGEGMKVLCAYRQIYGTREMFKASEKQTRSWQISLYEAHLSNRARSKPEEKQRTIYPVKQLQYY